LGIRFLKNLCIINNNLRFILALGQVGVAFVLLLKIIFNFRQRVQTKSMKTSRYFLTCFFLSFFFLRPSFADDFYGIEPGRSSKTDVEKMLGQATQSAPLGEWEEYRGANYDAEKIVAHYQLNNATVEKIDIYPSVSSGEADYHQWLSLDDSGEVTKAADGSRLKIYRARGIMLKFSGPAETDPIQMITHFPAPGRTAVQAATPAVTSFPPQSSGRKYLGVEIQYDNGSIHVVGIHPGSPAERGGLAVGDRILGSGAMRFQSNAEFVAALQRLPVNYPVQFFIQRNGKVLEFRIPLELRSEAEIQAIGEQQRQIRETKEQETQAEAQRRRQNVADSIAKVVAVINEQVIQKMDD